LSYYVISGINDQCGHIPLNGGIGFSNYYVISGINDQCGSNSVALPPG
jgi:hypothetical protein